MTKQEQIEEMAKIVDEMYNVYTTTADDIAEGIYDAGYRKVGEAEIERLKAENEELTKVVSSKVYDLIDNTKEIADAREAWEKQAKIEAVKDFAEKLKKYSYCDNDFMDGKWHRYVLVSDIDELLKEYE